MKTIILTVSPLVKPGSRLKALSVQLASKPTRFCGVLSAPRSTNSGRLSTRPSRSPAVRRCKPSGHPVAKIFICTSGGFMTLTQSLTDYVRAAFSGLYVQTVEPDEALREITALCQSQAWRLVTWDLNRGLTPPGSAADLARDQLAADPLAVVRTLSSLADPEVPTLCVLRGFHRFLGSRR